MKSKKEPHSKNLLEWIVFGISILLLVTAAGLLISAWIKTPGGPAHLIVQTGKAVVSGDRIEIPVVVSNNGQTAAANVQVSIVIGEDETERESGFTLDFLPPGGKRLGSVSFQGKELPAKTAARIASFTDP